MSKKISKIKVLLFALISIFIIDILFYQSLALTSVGGNFTVTPDSVFVNWTGSSFSFINITSNVDSVYFLIANSTASITPQYFETGVYETSEYQNLNSQACISNGKILIVQNETGSYTNETFLLNATNSTIYNLSVYQFCPPGYYYGLLNITQNNTNDWLNLSVKVNIPINPENTFSEPNKTAYLKGIVKTGSEIHKYYFNTSLAENLTYLTIRLSGYTNDIDLYLITSDNSLISKSSEIINETEEINVELPSSSDIWQIWIWGNVSQNQNYRADLYFSTLNITNSSNPDQKITSLNFGLLTPENYESEEVNITLTNVDIKTWEGVKEKKEIYRIERFVNQNAANNYLFYVPHYATKVKAKIEWEGGTRWFISLYDSNSNLIGNSSQKYIIGNKSGFAQEEVIVYSGAINENNDGFWKLSVGNLSQIDSNDRYNVTIYIWQNASEFIISDYPSSGFNFNSSGYENSTKNISLKLSLPLPKIVNGTYEGYIDYYVPSKWNLRIPLTFEVKAGNLLFNETPKAYEVEIKDNIGFNRLNQNVLKISIPFANKGDQPIYFINQTSSNVLSLDPTHNMTFVVEWPTNPIDAEATGELKINISINSSLANLPGIYKGWIFFNTTNSTNASSSSYPFQTYNITLRVNLTNSLMVNVTGINPLFIANLSQPNNVTINVTVSLLNGTILSSISDLLTFNEFYDLKLKESNTSYVIDLQNISSSIQGVHICPGYNNYCSFNASIPSGRIGGMYYLIVNARFNTSYLGGSGVNLTGSAQSVMLIHLNETGIELKEYEDNEYSIQEGSSVVYKIYVKNYGPLDAKDLQIRFNKGSCTPLSVARNIASGNLNCSTSLGCSGATGGSNSATDWKIGTLNGYGGFAQLAWTLSVASGSLTENKYCDDISVEIISPHKNYGNLTSISFSLIKLSQQQQQQPQQQIYCASNASCADNQYCVAGNCINLNCPSGMVAKNHKCIPAEGKLEIINYTSKVYVLQDSTNITKVTVKNTGNLTHTVKLKIEQTFDDISFSISPPSYSLSPGNAGIFTINFSATKEAKVGYRTLTIKTYASDNESVYDSKTITVGIIPLEETKIMIEQRFQELQNKFEELSQIFDSLSPTSDSNYTLANRSYYRILSMLKDIEEKINAGDYVEAGSLLEDASNSLSEFEEQLNQLKSLAGFQLPDTFTLVAIFVAIFVIIAFLIYLLLPPKKSGYHPTLGYTPPQSKTSITQKIFSVFSSIKKSFSKIKKPSVPKGQKTLASFEPETSQPLPAQQKSEKKTYMEGYHRLGEFPFTYEKDRFKEKKK